MFEGATYPINVYDANGNCIYTELENGKWYRRYWTACPESV